MSDDLDIPRLMRESGMTFHLGLPHQAVVEQLERLVALAVREERARFLAALACTTQMPTLTHGMLIRLADACAAAVGEYLI